MCGLIQSTLTKTPFTVSYRLRARFPVRVSTGGTLAYEYYNPANRGVAVPGALVVKR